MLRPRIIPCLLVKNNGLVKTVNFSNGKYVGDPINAVKIFNEKIVDELIVLDVDATVQSKKPNYDLIKSLAAECRMPLCYGGGVRKVEQVEKIVSLGVEKVAMSAELVANPGLIAKAAEVVGSQSIVVVIDVRKNKQGDGYEVWTHNGTKSNGLSPVLLAKQAESLGAGEIVINSIDRDGVMKGYDLELIREIREVVHLPVTALGGAGSLTDIEELIKTFGIIGAAAGSLFVFKGKYKAVLINYPNPEEKDQLIMQGRKCQVAC
ncbi:MAG: AglZ/HisF2 family acetamidino modification protein [Syntrophorhabdaceae bacterium]